MRRAIGTRTSEPGGTNMWQRLMLLVLMSIACAAQIACAPLAAGVAGAAVGHEIAEEKAEDERDED
jgi:hypothetical protein